MSEKNSCLLCSMHDTLFHDKTNLALLDPGGENFLTCEEQHQGRRDLQPRHHLSFVVRKFAEI